MKYIHVKKLEKYHPGYKDRKLQWCKAYFEMINANPEFEMLCEVDKWRFIAFIMLELQLRKPIPIYNEWFDRKGFDLKKRPMSLTIQMLHNFIDVSETRNETVTQSRVEKSKNKSKSRYGEFVLLLQEEHKKLIDELGEPRIESLITDLNNYIGSTGRRYKSHYHTILTWAQKEIRPKPTEAQKRTAASFGRLDKMEGEK